MKLTIYLVLYVHITLIIIFKMYVISSYYSPTQWSSWSSSPSKHDLRDGAGGLRPASPVAEVYKLPSPVQRSCVGLKHNARRIGVLVPRYINLGRT